jgi:hypothetical protein
MSTIRLTAQQTPALQPTLELQSAARYPLTATTATAAEAWQQACRSTLAEALGFLDTPPVDPTPHRIETTDRLQLSQLGTGPVDSLHLSQRRHLCL